MVNKVSKINIFVSHRIDIYSELVNNPIYYPVRCGAVFDTDNYNDIPGDNTGDNISEKRMSFCEFTVQYWAWKNVVCDYYGLCHYRRFLSFSDKKYKSDCYGMSRQAMLTPSGMKRFKLLDPKKMETVIEENDLIINMPGRVSEIPTPCGFKQTVREMWEAHNGVFFEISTIDRMFDLIDALSPEYSNSAREYFDGKLHRGFNCYIMKRELFNRMCEFQFPILFELEKMIDTSGYTQTMARSVGFVGEMLYGIFIYHILKHEELKYKELQLVYFANTDKIKGKFDLAKRYVVCYGDKALRVIVDPIFPIGSKRRELLKRVVFKVFRIKPRGQANIQ